MRCLLPRSLRRLLGSRRGRGDHSGRVRSSDDSGGGAVKGGNERGGGVCSAQRRRLTLPSPLAAPALAAAAACPSPSSPRPLRCRCCCWFSARREPGDYGGAELLGTIEVRIFPFFPPLFSPLV
ncbi:UNVERIFIED_CONTAM: hypothetical protein K2H54_039700 [Gekko kuhli]